MQGSEEEIDLFTLLDLWKSELTTDQIAKELGISRSKLFLLARQHKLASRKRARKRITRPTTPDPTPEEIRIRAQEIRSQWSDSEELRRRKNAIDIVSWRVPQYTFDANGNVFDGT